MRLLLCIAALLATSGCDWTGRQADALGEYMPVIDYRCEHWQCITSSGKGQSDANKAKAEKEKPCPPRTPPAPLSDEALPDDALEQMPPFSKPKAQ